MGGNLKLTDGIISAESGIKDDPRVYQISVPVQAGNSGGPLLNDFGEVVGIVTSKLHAVKMFQWTGDLPENVNYAVKIHYLKALIEGTPYKEPTITELPRKKGNLEELVERLKNSVFIIIAE